MDESLLTDQAIIRRMVLKRCIYGVDKNPLTVELAKVSLWLHSFTVGAPLSFLDHHLRCGDSLIGMRVQGSIEELRRMSGLFASSAIQAAENATAGMQRIEEMSDADVAEVRESAALFRGVEETTAEMRGLLDFLCGLRWLTAGMTKKARTAFESPLVDFLEQNSQDAYRLLALGPGGMDASAADFEALWSDARALADRERFLHWEAAFPGVWHGWQDVRPQGGFDAVIGNPPWDRIKLQEVEWFATRSTELALAPTAAERRAGIRRLRQRGDPLADQFDAAKDQADSLGQLVRASGDYPLLGGGDINLYSLFVERAMDLIKPDGFVGLLTPSGIYADKTAARFFKSVSTSGRLSGLFDFENRNWTAALLPRRGLAVQVLRPDLWRGGAAVRRDRVRLLPPRHQDHQRPGPLLPAGPVGLRPGEPEHGHCARIPHATGRGDHPWHLRAASGVGGPVRKWRTPCLAGAVRADVRHDQRLPSLQDGGAARC